MRNISELPQATLEKVSNVFRSIADAMDDNEYGSVTMAAVVIRNADGKIETFGAGGADFYRAIALFNLGIDNVIRKQYEF